MQTIDLITFLFVFKLCTSHIYDNGNHMYLHEILSDNIPLYIYDNCYFYHNLYDHVLSIARISINVIVVHITITFIILLQFHLFT